MKKVYLPIAYMFICSVLFAGNGEVDSLRGAWVREKTDTGRILLLAQISRAFQESRPDSALLTGQEALYGAKKLKFIKGQSWALAEMALAYNNLGNFPRALENYLLQLKIEETRGYADNIAGLYLNIALLYDNARDYTNALEYAKKADAIINEHQFATLKLYSLLDIGEIYEKMNRLDSAFAYTRNCYTLSEQAKNALIAGTALNNLGNIQSKSGNYAEALQQYRLALPRLNDAGDKNTLAESMLGIARVFDQQHESDSAITYGERSFRVASENNFLLKSRDASAFLAILYKKSRNTDSAFAYQEIMLSLRDSIESHEKIREVQNITTEEELRQKEMAQARETEYRERKEKLQLLVIGILIPLFFLFSIFISRRKVHRRLIEFSGIISILLLFEYITLLLHPFIAEKTEHSPLFEIVIFVAIAAIITPTHQRIEHWLITKLTHNAYLKHHPLEETA